jgi:exodeoxyribonuclease VII small subunit
MSKKSQDEALPPSFEQAFTRLEEILEQMNEGKTPLDQSLQLYREADKLIAQCQTRLTQAEQEIEMLIKNREGELTLDKEGRPLSQSFGSQPFGQS